MKLGELVNLIDDGAGEAQLANFDHIEVYVRDDLGNLWEPRVLLPNPDGAAHRHTAHVAITFGRRVA